MLTAEIVALSILGAGFLVGTYFVFFKHETAPRVRRQRDDYEKHAAAEREAALAAQKAKAREKKLQLSLEKTKQGWVSKLKGLFGAKNAADPTRTHAIVTLWEPILPVDRDERYADPLGDALRGLGEVVGGDTQMTEAKEIEYVNIELDLFDVDAAVPVIKRVLEDAGAPRLSNLLVDGRDSLETFGTVDALAIFLAPGRFDENEAWQAALSEGMRHVRSVPWEVRHIQAWDDGRVAVFFYTPNAGTLWRDIEQLVRQQPASAGARVVVRFGHPDLKPVTLTI